jgi:hypothetical protein
MTKLGAELVGVHFRRPRNQSLREKVQPDNLTLVLPSRKGSDEVAKRSAELSFRPRFSRGRSASSAVADVSGLTTSVFLVTLRIFS